MGDAQKRHLSKKNNVKWLLLLASFLLVVTLCVAAFLNYYDSYIDNILYQERLSQMREVTLQLFTGLEDAVENQWKITENQCNHLLWEQPGTMEELIAFLKTQMQLEQFEEAQTELMAIDREGRCYTQDGQKGTLREMDILLDSPESLSFVTNAITTRDTRMVFLIRLSQPVTVESGNGPVTLLYYGISQNMEELMPYFDCAAYGGSSNVYVMDINGCKLFGSRKLLRGHNVYSVLERMEYLHGSTFADTKKTFEEGGLAYSNAVMEETEYFYALYRMEDAKWTLMFLVPSSAVATDTVELINATVRLIMIFAVTMVVLCTLLVFLLLRVEQKRALAAERRNNETLERLNGELKAASKAKSDFLTNMSHDIRTPMNAIVGITSLMEHESGLSERLRGYIQKVQLSSRHLLGLINDILDMSKIESSEVQLSNTDFFLSEQLKQVDSIIQAHARERGQSLNLSVREIRHDCLLGDCVRLRQILLNLLSNAVKYTPNGGTITFAVEETDCPVPDAATFRFTVADTGCGMEKEFMEHIFEPFTREENSVTNRVQGTGLGMAITKNIIDLMGGEIRIDSAPGMGSHFEILLTFTLDLTAEQKRRAAECRDRRGLAEEAEGGSILFGMRFLCAEDNELNAEILEALLEMQGAACVIYRDGEELVQAFETVQPGEYDAILMDVQMPKMNGYEATRAIRTGRNPLGQTIPIIAMTANAFSDDVQQCLEAGMNLHIAKPIDMSLLEKAMARVAS